MPPKKNAITREALEDMLNEHQEPQTQPPEPPQRELPEFLSDDKDFKDTIKESLIEISTLPMPTGSEKRKKFKEELQNNKFLTKYLDRQVNSSYLRYVNDHVKAAMIYSYTFTKVHRSL